MWPYNIGDISHLTVVGRKAAAVDPYADFTSPYDVDCPLRGWLVTALLPPPWRAPPSVRGAAPALVEYAGTS